MRILLLGVIAASLALAQQYNELTPQTSAGNRPGALLFGTTDPGVTVMPTIAQSKAVSADAGDGTTFDLSPYSDIEAGNQLLVFARCDNAAVTSVSDDLGTEYALILSQDAGHAAAFLGSAATSGTATITFHADGGCGYVSMGITAVAGSSGVEASATSSGTGGPPPVTTTSENVMLVLASMNQSATAYYPGDWSSIDDQSSSGEQLNFVGHQLAQSPGEQNPSITSDGSGANFSIAMAPGAAVDPGGVNGDFYVNLTTGELWGPRADGVWYVSDWKFYPRGGGPQ